MMNAIMQTSQHYNIFLLYCKLKYISILKRFELQQMDRKQQLLSLWIGPTSQRLAHHFYALQAQQIFQDQEDPVYQRSLWEFKDKEMIQKSPKMMIFDTASDHLVKIRKVNHKKILKKMKQPTKEQAFFNFEMLKPDKEEEQQDPDFFLFSNWRGKQDNYVLIDKKFNQERISYNEWQNIYKYQKEMYEDRIRKRLQKQDYLSLFTLCTDGQNLGFTQKLIYYLKQACSKKPIIMTNISDLKSKAYFGQSFIPLLGNITNEIQLLVDIENNMPKYKQFESGTFYDHLSPIVNSIYTPFILKNSNSQQYLHKIDSGNRNLFNIGSTLPIIDQQEHLHKETNIFQYMPKIQGGKGKKKKQENAEEQKVQNHINYTNRTFLNIFKQQDKKKVNLNKLQRLNPLPNKILAQSYVLKGHFKQIKQYYNQNSSAFQIKYLRGVFASNPNQILKYNDFYKKDYGQIVQNFPLHTILYQHSAFGPAIRNFVRQNKLIGFDPHELVQEWRQNVLSLSDKYGQEAQNSDND